MIDKPTIRISHQGNNTVKWSDQGSSPSLTPLFSITQNENTSKTTTNVSIHTKKKKKKVKKFEKAK